jgi:hypothetical protein
MGEMPVGQPVPDDPTDPPGGDLHSDLTDEQVEAALDGETAEPTQDEDETKPQPEQPKPAVEGDAPAVPEAEQEPEPPLSAEDRLAVLESQVRVERLEREKAEAIAERERFLHSRAAGEMGHLKKMLNERRPETDGGYVPTEETARPEIDDIRTEINALKAERVQQGVAEELSNFQRAYPDAVKDEQALTEIVQRKLPDYREFLNGNDPKLARTMTRSLLKECYAELRIEREQATKASAATKSYDQAQTMRARKIASAPASTTRTAPQRARPKSIDDLSDAELDALTDEHVRNSV